MQLKRLLVLCGVLGLVTNVRGARADESPQGPAERLVNRQGVLVIAHRGDSAKAPENTLPAFDSAVKAKADLVELDYYHSADAVPVVIHDSTLDRTTNSVALWNAAKERVANKSVAELKQLDAGAWFSRQFAGTRIPTLAEALDTIQAGSMTLIERKGGEPAPCVALLNEKKLLDDVVVQSFDWDYLAGCHELAPRLVLGALGSRELTSERLDKIVACGARVVGWEDRDTTAATIDAIHGRGLKAWVWTVDDPRRVRALVEAKVDGIITNRPAETRAVVEATAR